MDQRGVEERRHRPQGRNDRSRLGNQRSSPFCQSRNVWSFRESRRYSRNRSWETRCIRGGRPGTARPEWINVVASAPARGADDVVELAIAEWESSAVKVDNWPFGFERRSGRAGPGRPVDRRTGAPKRRAPWPGETARRPAPTSSTLWPLAILVIRSGKNTRTSVFQAVTPVTISGTGAAGGRRPATTSRFSTSHWAIVSAA